MVYNLLENLVYLQYKCNAELILVFKVYCYEHILHRLHDNASNLPYICLSAG